MDAYRKTKTTNMPHKYRNQGLYEKWQLKYISQLTIMCPRSSDPSYIVTYYIKLVTTSWTYSSIC